MAFYEELVDAESAEKFFAEAMETIAKLGSLPRTNAVFQDNPNLRKAQMAHHKVAIIYLIDDDHLEIIAIRANHQMQNPGQYQESIRKRINKLRD